MVAPWVAEGVELWGARMALASLPFQDGRVLVRAAEHVVSAVAALQVGSRSDVRAAPRFELLGIAIDQPTVFVVNETVFAAAECWQHQTPTKFRSLEGTAIPPVGKGEPVPSARVAVAFRAVRLCPPILYGPHETTRGPTWHLPTRTTSSHAYWKPIAPPGEWELAPPDTVAVRFPAVRLGFPNCVPHWTNHGSTAVETSHLRLSSLELRVASGWSVLVVDLPVLGVGAEAPGMGRFLAGVRSTARCPPSRPVDGGLASLGFPRADRSIPGHCREGVQQLEGIT